MKKKNKHFFIIFKGFPAASNFLGPENAPLSHTLIQSSWNRYQGNFKGLKTSKNCYWEAHGKHQTSTMTLFFQSKLISSQSPIYAFALSLFQD